MIFSNGSLALLEFYSRKAFWGTPAPTEELKITRMEYGAAAEECWALESPIQGEAMLFQMTTAG